MWEDVQNRTHLIKNKKTKSIKWKPQNVAFSTDLFELFFYSTAQFG